MYVTDNILTKKGGDIFLLRLQNGGGKKGHAIAACIKLFCVHNILYTCRTKLGHCAIIR